MMKKVSIILPVYNNSLSLPIVLERIGEIASQAKDLYTFEVVMVDDGSIDGSWTVMTTDAQRNFDVLAIKLSRNFGQVGAVMAGWKNCTGDVIINLSADLQDPIELIPLLLKKNSEGNEIVLGERETRSDSFARSITSKIAARLLKNSLGRDGAVWFDVSLMTRRVLDNVNGMGGHHRFFQRDILHAGFKFTTVSYHRGQRPYGKSGFTQSLRLKLFIDAIVDSARGLVHFFSFVSIGITFASFAYGTWIIFARITGLIPSNGWAPIMVAILFSTSMITLMLSLICEYLWRIYDNQRGRLPFVVSEELTFARIVG
jgi:dolichol-phosphate mannosyltransferase